MRQFFIAAGHGGDDPGSCANDTTEREENIRVVNEAVEFAKPFIPEDTQLCVVPHDLAVVETVSWINSRSRNPGHDLALELHHNSNTGTPGTGTEVWFGNYEFAKEIKNAIVEFLGLNDRGLKSSPVIYFNAYTKPASCVVELAFLNHPGDLRASRAHGGEALGRAIVVAAGGEVNGQGPPEPPADNEEQEPPFSDLAVIISKLEELLEMLRRLFSPSVPTVTTN
jgi:hypothetical protein